VIEPERRRLVVWEARHENGWTTVVMKQPDGTFVAWAGVGDTHRRRLRGGLPRARSGRHVRVEAEIRARAVLVPLFAL
jgi:hypothetical protein